MHRIWRPILAGVALLTLLLAACDDEDDESFRLPPDENIIRIGDQPFADHGTVDARGEEQIRMEANAFYFEPTFIRGNPGQALTIEIFNGDEQNVHSFNTGDAQSARDIPPGGAERIALTFPQSGVMLFFCRYHIEQAMRGELLVGDESPQPVP